MADRPFRCPTFVESFTATCALWPRGRAWPVSNGATPAFYLAWFAGLVGLPAVWPTGFVQAAYTAAIAAVRNYVETRLCALRLEFWCQTQSETHDQWMIEYGLPDICDPFPDLCTKVAAIGGTRCEYYATIAARAGWTITCETVTNDCGDSVGCLEVGCGTIGPQAPGSQILITVYLSQSPAYTAAVGILPYIGNFEIGAALACEPDITALQCVLERVVHAHVTIVYETVS